MLRKSHSVITEEVREELASFSSRHQDCNVRLYILLGCRMATLGDKNIHVFVNKREGRLFNLEVLIALNLLLFGFTKALSNQGRYSKKKKKLQDVITRCQCDPINKLSFQEHLQFWLFCQVLLELSCKAFSFLWRISIYINSYIGEKWSRN